MTAFLLIIPKSARTPRMATKPSGLPESINAATTPISPSGATLRTMNSLGKLWSWTMRTVNMTNSITGTTASTDACDFWLSSTVPPTTTLYDGGRVFWNFSMAGNSEATTPSGNLSPSMAAWTVKVGTRSRRQTSGNSWSYSKEAN